MTTRLWAAGAAAVTAAGIGWCWAVTTFGAGYVTWDWTP